MQLVKDSTSLRPKGQIKSLIGPNLRILWDIFGELENSFNYENGAASHDKGLEVANPSVVT